MPLRRPTRLPKHLNRPFSSYTRALARKKYRSRPSFERFQRGILHSLVRRSTKFLTVFWQELRLWIIGFGVAGAVVLLIVLLISPVFNVREIRVRRQDARLDIGEIQRALTPLLRERLFFITKAQVLSLLQEDNPELTKIEIDKDYPSLLTVTLFVDPIVAEVRLEQTGSLDGSGSLLATQTGSYLYLGAKGYLVRSPIKLTQDRPHPVLTLTDWGVVPAKGPLLVSPDHLNLIFGARDLLRENFGLSSTKIVVYLRAREFHIHTNKVSLWFDLETPLPLQFQRFREFLSALSLDQAKEYIDLRISDRVIYK